MRILHICSYYIGNKLYMNLMKQLSLDGVNQEVFIPIRKSTHFGKNQLPSEFNTVKYYYKNILNRCDRFLFHTKINKQMKEIEKTIITNVEIDFIHSHTVFSDGGTAYKIHKKYGINYIVNVRNTDINTFYKYAIHLRAFMYKVLLNASAIVFISHAYKQTMFSLLPSRILEKIEKKCYVIPNAIEDYWHERSMPKKIINTPKEITLLFIGSIDKNKNLELIIRASAELSGAGYDVSLHIIGSGLLEEKLKELCNKLNIDNKVIFHGYINDKETISDIMNNCNIFIMPSFRETFGLVYIEAMSRGIPVIYSKGQGIDGFFDEGEVGFSVDPSNVHTIVEAIKKIKLNYNNMSIKCVENSKKFNWSSISKQYINIYNKNLY
jgi:L-malate glycosyltransferase